MESQKRIMTGLGGLMSLALLVLTVESGKKLEMLGIVSGLLRIFPDLQLQKSSTRKNLILKKIYTSLRETLSSTEVEEWLFGANSEDRVKAAKALTTASSALKVKRQSTQNNQVKTRRARRRVDKQGQAYTSIRRKFASKLFQSTLPNENQWCVQKDQIIKE